MGTIGLITLDSPYSTYYPGQTVKGQIEYKFDRPIKVRRIIVEFKGEARTQIRRSGSGSDGGSHYRYGNEQYFLISYYLLGSDSGGETAIPAGKKVYDFTCDLPPQLPSSFEGHFGHVRYTIKVTLDRKLKFNMETMVTFTVISVLDLNLDPLDQEPIHMHMEKKFWCLCCTSNPLSVDVRAPVSGYCPGQVIPVRVDIENKSNVRVNLVRIILGQVVTYKTNASNTSVYTSEDALLTIAEGPAPARSTKHWELKLEVPQLPTSYLTNCNLIDLEYFLMAECVVPYLHMNLMDNKHLTIGTVPIEGGVPSPSKQSKPGPSAGNK